MKVEVIGVLLAALLGACAPAARPAAPATPAPKEVVYVVVTATPVPAKLAELVDGCSEKLRVKRCIQKGGTRMLSKVAAGGDAGEVLRAMEWMMKAADPDSKEFADPSNFMKVFMAGGINLGAVEGAVITNKSTVGNWSCWMEANMADSSTLFWCEAK